MTLVRGDSGPEVGAARGGSTPRGSWLAAVAEAQQQVAEAGRGGSDPTPLLERLVATVSALLDAPAAVAVPREGRLLWWAASGDASVARGEPVVVDSTLTGTAWRTGTAQRARRARALPNSPEEAEQAVAEGLSPSPGADRRQTTDHPASTPSRGPELAVPLVHGTDVLGVLTLASPSPGWFDRNDERAVLLLAGTAASALSRGPVQAQLPALPVQLARRDPAPAPVFSPPTPAALFLSADRPGRRPPPSMPDPQGLGLWEWDAESGLCTWSGPVRRLLGLADDDPVTTAAVRDALHPADRARFDAAVKAVLGGHGVSGALRLQHGDEPPRHVHAWSEVLRHEDGRLAGAWGAVVDVSTFEYDAAALRSSMAGLSAAQQLTGLGVWEWHPDTGDLTWSAEMFRLVGLEPGQVEPTLDRWHAFVHPEDVARARTLDLGALEQRERRGDGIRTFRVVREDGEVRHVQSWSSASGDGTRAPQVVNGAVVDVTRQVRDRVMLERLSTTDTVTELGNRLAFDRRMQDLLARPGRDVTLLLLDLDRFKLVNDSLGHQVGDKLLHAVAQRLLDVVPEGSTTARMGGDEFVVVPPPGMPRPAVEELAERIVETLRAPYTLPESGEMLICPVSVGVASTGLRHVTLVDLLREADIALYRAKDSGRDRHVVFDDTLRTRAQARQRSERRLREALERDLLLLEYQPIVDFAHGRVVGAEALIRMKDPEDAARILAPDMFMDVAEDTGLVVEVDTWVIGEAIEELARWGDRAGAAGEPPWLAINVSARSMEHPRVARRIIDAVTSGELTRDRIKVELTEHSFLGALPGGEASLRDLMAAGIRVGIDDFGTGYSALAYLTRFQLDFMKIDRSFVRDVGAVPRADAVVTAIVDLAHAHGMRVVAEGVETTKQARRLREIGCDYAQGYHFGRPGAAHRILRRA